VVTPSHQAFRGPIKSFISLSHFFVSVGASMEVISQVYTHRVFLSKKCRKDAEFEFFNFLSSNSRELVETITESSVADDIESGLDINQLKHALAFLLLFSVLSIFPLAA
jgi:hypothetical protein